MSEVTISNSGAVLFTCIRILLPLGACDIYIYRERERERYIIKFCVCEMPAAAYSLQGSNLKLLGLLQI